MNRARLLSAPALQLTGSTTLQPRLQHAAEAYMQLLPAAPARIVINGGCGSARGYKALLDGTTDIAMASGPEPESVASLLATRGQSLHATILSRDAMLAVVHASNPLDSVTLRQLANIFSGRSASWRALGGAEQPIEVLVGPPSGGVSLSWRRQVLDPDDTYTPACQVLSAGARLALLASRPYAISFMPQVARLPAGLKALRVNDIDARLAPQAYALYAPMSLVTLGAPSAAAARFIGYAAARSALPASGAPRE